MSSINLTAHGLTAGTRVAFKDVVPTGTGLDEDIVYTVTTAGLLTDSFQISIGDESDDPVTLSLDVTSANMWVVPETTDSDPEDPTYVPITDAGDVHAPPTTLPQPDAPVINGISISGVNRLSITLPAYTDTAVRLRQHEIQVTHRYSDEETQTGDVTGVASTDVVTKTAHGFVGGESIRFKSVTGGTGITLDLQYYVLATGITADTFQFSETAGGAAFDFTSDITAATIALLVTPYADFSYRQEFVLPRGSSAISIPCLPNTTYAVRTRAQDVYGNYSVFSAESETTTGAEADSVLAGVADFANDIPDGTVTSDKIVSNNILARHILAHEITADHLATTLLLASLIRTAESGQRLELDVDGFRIYDASDVPLVRLPTDGTANYFKGEVTASALTSTTQATFDGEVSLSGDAIMTLQTGVSAPTSIPTLTASVDYLSLTSTPGSVAAAAGITYDSTGDSSNGSYWVACDPTVSPYYVAQEFAATSATGTAGRLLNSIAATGSSTTAWDYAGATTHISDTAQARDSSTESNIATPIVMPSTRGNMTITAVSVYIAGYVSDETCRNCLWSEVTGTGTLLSESASYTAVGRSFGAGNSNKYNKSLSTPQVVAPGATVYAGWRRTSNGPGFQWDRDDGSGKTTKAGTGYTAAGTDWVTWLSSSKPNVYVTYSYQIDTRVETAPNIGIATDGTYIWTLDNTGKVWTYNASTLAMVGTSGVNLSAYIGDVTKAGLFYDATQSRLIVVTYSGTNAKFVRCTLSSGVPAYSDNWVATGDTVASTDTFRGGVRVNDALNSSHPTWWIVRNGTVYGYDINSGTGAALTANRDFGATAYTGGGVTHDGTVFRGYYNGSSTKVWKFSSWDWTTGGSTWWVGYAWYANTGGYVTQCGPTTSVTVARRQRLLVQNSPLPGGTADRVRIYSYQGASDAAAGSRWLQVTDALTSRYVTSYATTTHDSTTNTFSSGSPAELKSAPNGWGLYGDGSFIIPSCKVMRLTTFGLTDSTWTPVTFNEADEWDPYGMHDPSSNPTRIYLPIAGIYRVDVFCYHTGGGVPFRTISNVWKNQAGSGGTGDGYIGQAFVTGMNTTNGFFYSDFIVCTTPLTDYVEVFVWDDGGAVNWTVQATVTYMGKTA